MFILMLTDKHVWPEHSQLNTVLLLITAIKYSIFSIKIALHYVYFNNLMFRCSFHTWNRILANGVNIMKQE